VVEAPKRGKRSAAAVVEETPAPKRATRAKK